MSLKYLLRTSRVWDDCYILQKEENSRRYDQSILSNTTKLNKKTKKYVLFALYSFPAPSTELKKPNFNFEIIEYKQQKDIQLKKLQGINA